MLLTSGYAPIPYKPSLTYEMLHCKGKLYRIVRLIGKDR